MRISVAYASCCKVLQLTIARFYRLAFAKYSSIRYFRNVNRLFLIGVGGFTPEHFLPATHGLPHFTSAEG
jgi:hypothetical protein